MANKFHGSATYGSEIDIRIVAATNRSLEKDVQGGRFRQDLYFRLSAATVVLPPVRDRLREIPILARVFLADACARAGRPAMTLAAEALQRLSAYPWPGNVRELKNAMEYAVATSTDGVIRAWDLPEAIGGPRLAVDAPGVTDAGRKFRPLADELKELERSRIEEALAEAAGVQTRAAELIGMPLRTFVLRLKQYGIDRRKP